MTRCSDLRDDSGQVLVVVALCMVVLIGFIGLAVDIGSVRHEQRRLQTAADAAALAGALEVRVCGGTPNCSAMKTAAQNALVENGYSGSTVITNCTTTPGPALTLMVNNPVCLSSTDPNKSKTNYVEAQVSETAPLYFSRVLGFNGFRIKARAEAARGLGGPCLYALNPMASGALNVGVGLGFRSNCGVVVESSDPTSVNCLVGLGVTAPEIQVSPTGGGASLLCLGSTHVTHAPVPVPADPLAYLPVPTNANDACGTGPSGNVYNGSPVPVNLALLANVIFNPGVYCGGISITATVLSNVTFNPGTYIIRDGYDTLLGLPIGLPQGGFNITISALTSIVGNGVMFYNEGNVLNPSQTVGGFSLTAPTIAGLSQFQLSAPTSGNYGGILFWQAKNIANTGTFVAPGILSAQQLNGIIYEPGATVSYTVNALSAAGSYNGIVADKLQFNVGVLSTFSNDYSTLQSGSPLGGDHAELVQ